LTSRRPLSFYNSSTKLGDLLLSLKAVSSSFTYFLPTKTLWRSGLIGLTFLTSELEGGEWSASPSGRFTPGERDHGIHWIGGWEEPRAAPDVMGLPRIEP
jgi:hypothetical protein